MKDIDNERFERLRRSKLREFGRMTSSDADGFIINLDHALETIARLGAVRCKWRGEEDGLFTATGTFQGDSSQVAGRIRLSFDDLAYGPDQAVATMSVSAGHVSASFATWADRIGLATVRLDAVQLDTASGDIPER